MIHHQTSEQIDALAEALAAAQAEIENVEKDGKNPHFKSRYATLSAVLDEVRPKFSKHGIAIVQMAVNGAESNIGVITRLVHKSGQWIESGLYVMPTKFDAQGAGSVISYLRRYALMAMAGVGQDDDDGEAAVRQPEPRRAYTGPAETPARAFPGDDDPFAPISQPANGLNKAALAPNPEEPPEVSAARKRIRGLIDKYDHIIKTAPSRHVLELSLDDGRAEISEIEAAGENGKLAAAQLRGKAMARFEQFDEAA